MSAQEPALTEAQLVYKRMHEQLMLNSKNQLAHWLLRMGAELDRAMLELKKYHDPHPK